MEICIPTTQEKLQVVNEHEKEKQGYKGFKLWIMRNGILLWGSSPRVKEILLLQKKLVRFLENPKFWKNSSRYCTTYAR
ncbi:hypothetical protein C0J52_06262 [Blattella germanica]|nr:hypothetical protein C0J52_06262 [Blattella germanica]